jgi:hypothetical protein
MPKKLDLAKRELWQSRLQEFQRENTTIVEFCRRVGAPVWSFYYWQKRLQPGTVTAESNTEQDGTRIPTRKPRLIHRARRGAAKSGVKFVPVQITGQHSVEVHLPNGARVTVPCQDHGAIGAVIAALVRESLEHRLC